ncbi:putative Selection and upkeep of intraepithelial T-cells protein 6 [Hibiscus syriacus]|uniref:Selection and upkeep of intraepithelial T-cells protein 6 n=1 Tax=Hibiscus syriacus TaxID=106335 RepID=A0A6A3AR65_HIBSY|nr:putative Selection and upkeep of intraepithelial T-cells protein 6 [Hibiscus syriacus]
MGKVPPSFRPAISNSLTRKFPLETPIPNHIPEKITRKKPPHHSRKPEASLASGKAETLFKSPELSSAKKVFNYIVATTKSSIDLRFHNTLLRSYASISTLHDSISLLHHMLKTQPLFSPDRSTYPSCSPNPVTTDIAIRSLCEVGRIDHAVELVKELSLKQSPPDTYTFNFLVKNLCKCRTLSTVYGFIDDMKSSFDIKPDLEVIEVYKKMKEEGVEPDLVTYNTLIFGLSKSGRRRECIGCSCFVGEMERKGCTPNSCTYNTLLHGLCKCRLMEKGMELYGAMKSAGMKLETASYATLVRALCREGRVAEAYDVFDYAVESKSLTDVAAYSTLEVTLKWLKKARQQGLAV